MHDQTPRLPTPTSPGDDVAVVIPSHNRPDFVARAVHSVLAQTTPAAEVIVVDDASGDDTADVAEAAGASVVRLRDNVGSGPARNEGIRAARSPWVAFLDSDDAWHPDHLEHLLSRVRPGHVLLAAAALTGEGQVRGNPGRRDRPLDAPASLATDLICTSGVLARRDALLEAGLFEPIPGAEDRDMWFRVLRLGSGLALARPTVHYEVHEAQVSQDESLMQDNAIRLFGDYRDRGWIDDRDLDRALVRVHWDAATRSARGRRLAGAARELRWIGQRPSTWSTLLRTVADRRSAERRVRAARS